MSRLRRRVLGALPPSDAVFVSSAVDPTDLQNYSFLAMNAGDPDPNRVLIVGGVMRSGAVVTLSSVTIGGIAATIGVESRNTSNALTSAFIAAAAVPLGLTADVAVNWSAVGPVLCGVGLIRTTKCASLVPTKTATDVRSGAVGTMLLNLASPDGGFQVGVAAGFGGVNRRITMALLNGRASSIVVDCQSDANSWAGLNEVLDTAIEAGAAAVMSAASAGYKYP